MAAYYRFVYGNGGCYMKIACSHPIENQRQQAVETFKKLDPRLKANFSFAARILQTVAKTSVTGFSLLDNQRHLFAPAFGDVLIESHRPQTFCAHTVLSETVFVIEDASRNEDFHDSPFVIGEPYVRFYAGIAIRSPSRLPIGALCAIDSSPRKLDRSVTEVLQDLREMLENDLCLAWTD